MGTALQHIGIMACITIASNEAGLHELDKATSSLVTPQAKQGGVKWLYQLNPARILKLIE